jgi:2-methylisocitrate lyase-like PEP mutase family enzyme
VINARIDVFLPTARDGRGQLELVDEALRRAHAHAYVDAGADCVFPILLWQPDAMAAFLAQRLVRSTFCASPRPRRAGRARGRTNELRRPAAP